MSGDQDPAYWRSLYSPPRESEGSGEITGFRAAIAAEDLVAERTGADGIESGKAAAGPVSSALDSAAVAALVQQLVEERLAGRAGSSVSAGHGASLPAPGEASEQPSQPVQMAAITPAQMAAASTVPEVAPVAFSSRSQGQADDALQSAPPWESDDQASTTMDDNFVPPWEELAEPLETSPLDTQASTVAINDQDVEVDDFVVEIDEEEGEDDHDIVIEAEDDQELVIEEVGEPEQVAAAVAGLEDLWQRVPILPGGQSALIGVEGLSPAAPMILVLIDGVSTLKGLKMLVPHVPDEEFEAIVQDGIARGLVVFS